jgi:hypothetical protein
MKKVTYCIEQIQTLLINCASRFLLFFKPPEVAVGKLTLQKGLLEARGGGDQWEHSVRLPDDQLARVRMSMFR